MQWRYTSKSTAKTASCANYIGSAGSDWMSMAVGRSSSAERILVNRQQCHLRPLACLGWSWFRPE